MFSPVRLLCAFVLALLMAAPVFAQDNGQDESEIGRLLMSIRTTDGKPIPNVPVVVKRLGERAEVAATTDASGTARVPADVLDPDSDIFALMSVIMDSDEEVDLGITRIPFRDERFELPSEQMGDMLSEGGSLADLLDDITLSDSFLPGGADTWGLGLGWVYLTDDPGVTCKPLYRQDEEAFFEDVRLAMGTQSDADPLIACGSAAIGRWGEGTQYNLELDTGCEPETSTGRARMRVTGGYLFPMELEGPDGDRPSDRDVDFFRPLILQFPDDLGRTTLAPPPGCTDDRDEGDLPETSLFLLHGYNIDFGDGSWGFRARTALPFFDDHPLGIEGGIDVYLQDDTRTTTALNVDLSYHLPWESLGDATAYGGGGLRAYVQSFSGASSSTNTEIGFGLVSGMTYPIGPVQLYGDVGVDRVYDAFVPVTHFGVGYAFGP